VANNRGANSNAARRADQKPNARAEHHIAGSHNENGVAESSESFQLHAVSLLSPIGSFIDCTSRFAGQTSTRVLKATYGDAFMLLCNQRKHTFKARYAVALPSAP